MNEDERLKRLAKKLSKQCMGQQTHIVVGAAVALIHTVYEAAAPEMKAAIAETLQNIVNKYKG